MTRKFRPTYWQLESSSMEYIIRECQRAEVFVKNGSLSTCNQEVDEEYTCFTPPAYRE